MKIPAPKLAGILAGFLLLQLFAIPPVFAQVIPPCIDTPIGCLSTDLETGELVRQLFAIFATILGLTAVINFIRGAYITMVSGDNPEELQRGRQIMTASVAGLIFLLLFVFIVDILGIDILSDRVTPW